MQYRFGEAVVDALMVQGDAKLIIMIRGDRDDRDKSSTVFVRANAFYQVFTLHITLQAKGGYGEIIGIVVRAVNSDIVVFFAGLFGRSEMSYAVSCLLQYLKDGIGNGIIVFDKKYTSLDENRVEM